MLFTKRVKILLALAISLFAIPEAFALFEGVYSIFYGGLFDPVQAYVQYNGFFRNAVHFVVFFYIFHAISEFFVVKQYGEEAKESKLPMGIGLLGAISLTALFFQNQWTLVGFAPLYLILGIVLILILIYNAIKTDDKTKLGWVVGLILIALFLIPLLFPSAYSYLGVTFPSLTELIWNTLLPLLVIIGLIGLAIWLVSKVGEFTVTIPSRIGRAREEEESGGGRSRDPNEDQGPKKGERLNVSIIITPDKKTYLVNDTINLTANITRGLIFKGRANSNYKCDWYIGNNPLDDHNTSIRAKLVQDYLDKAEQELVISVKVIDLNNTNSQKDATRSIVVISHQASIKVKHSEDSNPIERSIGNNEPIEFEYIVRNPGTLAKDVSYINWFILQGRQTVIDDLVINKAIRKVEFTNDLELSRSFEIPFGQDPLDLIAGEYTIIAVAMKGKKLWINANGNILGDRFFLKVNKGKGGSSGSNASEKIIIYNNKRNIIETTDKDTKISYETNKTLFFVPKIESGNIDDYEIEYTADCGSGDLFRVVEKLGNVKKTGVMKIFSDEEKLVSCTFKKAGKVVKVIEIIVEIKKKDIKLTQNDLIFQIYYDDKDFDVEENNASVNIPINTEFFIRPYLQNDDINNYEKVYRYFDDSGNPTEVKYGEKVFSMMEDQPCTKELTLILNKNGAQIISKIIKFNFVEKSKVEPEVIEEPPYMIFDIGYDGVIKATISQVSGNVRIPTRKDFNILIRLNKGDIRDYRLLITHVNPRTGKLQRDEESDVEAFNLRYETPGSRQFSCGLIDNTNKKIDTKVVFLELYEEQPPVSNKLKLDILQILPKGSQIKNRQHFVLDNTNNKATINELITYQVTPIMEGADLSKYNVIIEYRDYITKKLKRVSTPAKIKYLELGSEKLRCLVLDKSNKIVTEFEGELEVQLGVNKLTQVYIDFEKNEVVIPANKKSKVKIKLVDEFKNISGEGMIKEIVWILYKSIRERKILTISSSTGDNINETTIDSSSLESGESYYLVAYALPERTSKNQKFTRKELESKVIPEGTASILVTIK